MNNVSFYSPGYTGYGSALSLNKQKSQYVFVNKRIDMVNRSFTWEMWVYPKNLTSEDFVLVGSCSSTSTNLCLHLMIRQKKMLFAFYSNDCSGSTIIKSDQWYHFAFVYNYDIRTKFVYLNGNIECVQTNSAPYQGHSNITAIGAIYRSDVPTLFWSGYIDQLSYVPKVKTDAEILADATLVAYYSFDNDGPFLDSGPNNINGVNNIMHIFTLFFSLSRLDRCEYIVNNRLCQSKSSVQ